MSIAKVHDARYMVQMICYLRVQCGRWSVCAMCDRRSGVNSLLRVEEQFDIDYKYDSHIFCTGVFTKAINNLAESFSMKIFPQFDILP